MIALLVVLGCTRSLPVETTVPPHEDDRKAIEGTIVAWNAHQGLPRVALDVEILVTDATTDTFLGRCSACPPVQAAPECVSRRFPGLRANSCAVFGGGGPFTRSTPLVVIAPGFDARTRRSLIVHEVLHHLYAIGGLGHMDAGHADERVWCDYSQGGCVPGSVEYSARFP